jgi:preflagellin peptidase FlaK
MALVGGVATLPDLLRLAVIPVFAWAAWRDIRTRRVPNAAWLPVGLLGVVLLAVGVYSHLPVRSFDDYVFLLRVSLAVGILIPLAYGFWWAGGFGGADAKALMVLAVTLPVYPSYYLPGVVLPLERAQMGVFAMTVLTNAVLVGLAYPVVLGVQNGLAGQWTPTMFFARRVPVTALPDRHGSLFETREGVTRNGLDLDALRMYLRWRGTTLSALRDEPAIHRDPRSVGETSAPDDGAVGTGHEAATGSDNRPTGADADPTTTARNDTSERDTPSRSDRHTKHEAPTDRWAAARFLDEIEGSAYGTTAAELQDGLETVVSCDKVWVSPGIPFLVPVFLGLVIGLTYGDLLFGLLGALGVV